mmetsp:Transcript_8113/g.29935  ORF Transcript_8113/g.29935 Transcript_8113/m.29935 type:complete len:200 (-) Transcript_8113:400-999(-)
MPRNCIQQRDVARFLQDPDDLDGHPGASSSLDHRNAWVSWAALLSHVSGIDARQLTENREIRSAFIPLHLLTLLGTVVDDAYDRVLSKFLVRNSRKHAVRRAVIAHPVAELFHVCNGVEQAPLLEHVRVLGQQRAIDDAASMVGHFEVRVRKQEEDFGKLSLRKEVAKVLHCVGSNHGDIAILSRVLLPQVQNTLPDIL